MHALAKPSHLPFHVRGGALQPNVVVGILVGQFKQDEAGRARGQGAAEFGGGEGVDSVSGDRLICRRAYRRAKDDGACVVRVVGCLCALQLESPHGRRTIPCNTK